MCMNETMRHTSTRENIKGKEREEDARPGQARRENKYFSDTSFWEPVTINAEAFEYNHKEVKTEYSDSKTVHQKMQSFSVDAHFSLDLLGL